MRILHLDTGKTMRGGQWQALHLVEGLKEAGEQVTLAAPAGSPLLDRAERNGVVARPLTIGMLRRLAADADLIHVHDARAHALAAVFSRVPIVVSRRVAFRPKSGWISRWKYSRAAHYVAVSEFVRQVLEDAGVPPRKISVVHDGVAPAEPVRLGEDVVTLASDDPMKGEVLAAEAAREAGLPLRRIERLPEDLEGAAVFVYLSYAEGLGSGALIAMAAGVPVIASDTGGLPEIVRHEVTGLLTPNHAPQIAAAIGRLHRDRALAARLAAEARQMVKQEFSIRLLTGRTLDIYWRVLG